MSIEWKQSEHGITLVSEKLEFSDFKGLILDGQCCDYVAPGPTLNCNIDSGYSGKKGRSFVDKRFKELYYWGYLKYSFSKNELDGSYTLPFPKRDNDQSAFLGESAIGHGDRLVMPPLGKEEQQYLISLTDIIIKTLPKDLGDSELTKPIEWYKMRLNEARGVSSRL